jgi:hypothetical protein
MYKCIACGAVFNDPDSFGEDTGGYETGVGYYAYIEHFPCCPECGSEEFDKANYCHDCGSVCLEDELYLCNDKKTRCKFCATIYEVKKY